MENTYIVFSVVRSHVYVRMHISDAFPKALVTCLLLVCINKLIKMAGLYR